jgi:hypothetical protein
LALGIARRQVTPLGASQAAIKHDLKFAVSTLGYELTTVTIRPVRIGTWLGVATRHAGRL